MSIGIEQIYEKYHSKLRGYIHKRVGDDSAADDLLQDVFLKVYSKLGTLKTGEKIETWLYQITRNTIIDYYRARKPELELPESLSIPEPDINDIARAEIRDCLWPIIDHLPVNYRESLIWADMEGLSQKEIAVRQNISLSGAKSRVQRGRAMLKKMLLQCCRMEFDRTGGIIECEPRPDCSCN